MSDDMERLADDYMVEVRKEQERPEPDAYDDERDREYDGRADEADEADWEQARRQAPGRRTP